MEDIEPAEETTTAAAVERLHATIKTVITIVVVLVVVGAGTAFFYLRAQSTERDEKRQADEQLQEWSDCIDRALARRTDLSAC